MGTSNVSPVSLFPSQTESDIKFTDAESPIDIDITSLLGRNANSGQFDCLGPGRINVQLSNDGINFGDIENVASGKTLELKGGDVSALRLTLVDPLEISSYSIIASDPGNELSSSGDLSISSGISEPPASVTGVSNIVLDIIPAVDPGKRASFSLTNESNSPVYIAFDGHLPVIGKGMSLPARSGGVWFTSQLIVDSEIKGLSEKDFSIGIQVWNK